MTTQNNVNNQKEFSLQKTNHTNEVLKTSKTQKKDNGVFKIYLIYFISMALFSVVRIISGKGFLSGINKQLSSVIFTILIQVVIMTIVPAALYLLLFKTEKGKRFKNMLSVSSFKKISFKVVLLSFALGFFAFLVNIIVSTIFSLVLTILGYSVPVGGSAGEFVSQGFLMFLLEIVLVAVLPAIGEEFLHRGILLGETTKTGHKKAILISSLLFGLIHFNINQFSYAFVLGIIIAYVVVITKSIWPAIIIHFTNNAISLYLSYANANNWFGANFYEVLQGFLGSGSLLLTMLTTTLFMFFVIFSVLMIIIKMFKETTIKKVNKNLDEFMKDEESYENDFGIKPTKEEKFNVSKDILMKKSNLNFNIYKKTNAIDIMLPINRSVYKPSLFDNSFLVASLVLGSLSTLYTFIWGL